MSAASLRAWLQDNPRAPQAWRDLADRAIRSDDPHLWPPGVEPVPMFVAAKDALHQALVETARQPPAEEEADLEAVARAIAALRDAIERAPLPRGSATLGVITGGGLPVQKMLVGWRDVPDNLVPGAYATSIVNMLEAADRLLVQHRDGRNVRAVQRHRDRPTDTAFVRWLDYIARRRELPVSASALAAWCRVATHAALDARDVRVMLKDSPPELKVPLSPR